MALLKLFLIIPFAPLIASILVGFFGKKFPKYFSYMIPISGVSIAFLASIYTLYLTSNGLIFNEAVYQWLLTGDYIFEIGFLIRL